jgi:ABC-2 type transport system ATP-binding protein
MAVIETEKLTKFYGSHLGIVDVDLRVEQGEVFGFLGPNGAGKTTTIRLLLDLLRPTSGRACVFGIETTADPVAIHRRIGYLPGEFALFDRLTGEQTIEYFANLRGDVDPLYQADLIARFDLDPSRRFKEYSKGNKQKVGLVIALQHRPDLLILDEPTSGLDPLVQQTFFGLLRETVTEGRTAFLSSHILDEVERTCDRVAIIRAGRLVALQDVTVLLASRKRHVEMRLTGPPPVLEGVAGVSGVHVADGFMSCQLQGDPGPFLAAIDGVGLTDLTIEPAHLEEAFLEFYAEDLA